MEILSAEVEVLQFVSTSSLSIKCSLKQSIMVFFLTFCASHISLSKKQNIVFNLFLNL